MKHRCKRAVAMALSLTILALCPATRNMDLFDNSQMLTALAALSNHYITGSINGVIYRIYSQKDIAVVVGCTNSVQNIVIPETVSIPGTDIARTVKGMLPLALADKSNLRSVKIEARLPALPPSTFKNCTNLTKIVLPTSISSIPAQAFAGTKITSVNIPYSTALIESEAFSNCTALTDIVIHRPDVHIAADAFDMDRKTKTVYCYEGAASTYFKNKQYKIEILETADLDGDHYVTECDTILANRYCDNYLYGFPSAMTPAQMRAADVNGDGVLDSCDADAIAKAFEKGIRRFGCDAETSNWFEWILYETVFCAYRSEVYFPN